MIRLVAAGDICLGDSAKSLGFGVRAAARRDGYAALFEPVRPLLAGDLVFGNLETVTSEAGLRAGRFDSEHLRGTPDGAAALAAAGFNVVNVANNHAMQHGAAAFDETVAALESRGIAVVGRAGEDGFRARPVVREVRGQQVGWLGYSQTDENYCDPRDVRYAWVAGDDEVLADVRRLRPRVDWLVVSLHWGLEFMSTPGPAALELAGRLADAGVDVVLGHHPHVLQGIERRGDTVIAYSLGNLVFDMKWWDALSDSMLLRVALGGESRVDWDVAPLRIDDRYRPIPLEGAAATTLLREIEARSAALAGCRGKSAESYQAEHRRVLRHESLRGNWFLLRHLHRTPSPLLAGKLRHVLGKVLPG